MDLLTTVGLEQGQGKRQINTKMQEILPISRIHSWFVYINPS